MNDAALKSFCIWARNELRQQVAQQARAFGITEEGYIGASADSIDGRLLTNEQRNQRASLISSFLEGADDGYAERYEAMVERAAYTWFNRVAAIRFMEVNDRLFSHVRMFSSAEGAFEPQVLKEALEVDIEGVDHAHVADLLAEGDDEALFRYLFLAQCSELAKYMPEVFEPIGSAMELLLPQNLLRHGSVAERMVCDVPEEDWREGVEIVGWMYQYYNAELKDEVFASFKKGKKADAAVMKPATQLFTPNWIVRYLVENSLGRLWMQGHPDSRLPESMPYYIPDVVEGDDAASSDLTPDHEDYSDTTVSSPEGISVVDPACGSGHILVYAFELLGLIYEEAGYMRRDIPQLILQQNLSGIEIDPRAGQWTAFALYMKGCDYDSRFLKRGMQPNVTVLKAVSMEQEELSLVPHLEDRAKLLDAMEHMGECGSLFVPEEADMVALKDAEAQLAEYTDMFSDKALQKVRQMIVNCEPLFRTYEIVVANPPYMGSSNMDKWLANWTKKNYPNSKRDLCTCFIERGFILAKLNGYSAMITMQSWMFLGSLEPLRYRILEDHTIVSMAHLGARAFDSIGGEVVSTTACVMQGVKSSAQAGYVRLVDYDSEQAKQGALREAIRNPKCGWFYRRSADAFSAIPGTPIAYWASDAVIHGFEASPLVKRFETRVGMATADNDRFMRVWWEPAVARLSLCCSSIDATFREETKWYPYTKGGDYRKWYGNREYCVNWQNDGTEIRANQDRETGRIRSHNYNDEYSFLEHASWSYLSSGHLSLRYVPSGSLFDSTSGTGFSENLSSLLYSMALCNSSIASSYLSFLAPTLAFKQGEIERIPDKEMRVLEIAKFAQMNVTQSMADYDSFETSWDFKRHPMV